MIFFTYLQWKGEKKKKNQSKGLPWSYVGKAIKNMQKNASTLNQELQLKFLIGYFNAWFWIFIDAGLQCGLVLCLITQIILRVALTLLRYGELYEKDDIHNWERCNDLVGSWILNSVPHKICLTILYAETISKIWKNPISTSATNY